MCESNRKTYQCESCAQIFFKKDNFKNHFEQVHLQLKKPCHMCGKQFHPLSLKRHLRGNCLDSPKNKFQCSLCNKYYTRMDHLKTHEKKAHFGMKKTTLVAKNQSELANMMDLWCFDVDEQMKDEKKD